MGPIPWRTLRSLSPRLWGYRSVASGTWPHDRRRGAHHLSNGRAEGLQGGPVHLIPAGPLRTLAELYDKGAEKHEDRNCERGYDWSLSFAASNRHLWQFWGGEDWDSETGKPHLASVAWHAFALLHFLEEHPGFDNRPVSHV